MMGPPPGVSLLISKAGAAEGGDDRPVQSSLEGHRVLLIDGSAVAGEPGGGVGAGAVDLDLEVQVAAGGRAVATDTGDLLSGLHHVTGANKQPVVVHVAVGGGPSAAVVKDEPVAEAGRGPRVDDGAGGRCVDRRGAGRSDVGAGMPADVPAVAPPEGLRHGAARRPGPPAGTD